jgi:hypothetical protein
LSGTDAILCRLDSLFFLFVFFFFFRAEEKDCPDAKWICSVFSKHRGIYPNVQDMLSIFENERSDPRGMYFYSRLLYNLHVGEMTEEVQNTFRKAAEMGYVWAEVDYVTYGTDAAFARQCLLSAAGKEHPDMLYAMGTHLYRGDPGYSQSFEKALPFFILSEQMGNVSAADMLAIMFFRGEGVRIDLEAAIAYRGRSIGGGYVGRISRFSEVLVDYMGAYNDGAETGYTIIYALGKTMYLDVYLSACWEADEDSELDPAARAYSYQTMELYCEWNQKARESVLYFMLIRHDLHLPRDVAKIIAKEVWSSRSDPDRFGWYKVRKTPNGGNSQTKRLKL